MIYSFCAATDVGRARSHNEDSVALDQPLGLAVLADGMGGHKAGEVDRVMATSIVLADLKAWLADTASASPAGARELNDAMARSVEHANSAIRAAAQANPRYRGMGTTLVVAVFLDNELSLGHVGDSRCYRWRGGDLVQLTRDHSYVQEQIDAGRMTAEEANASGHRNLVTRALGVTEVPGFEVHAHAVADGDVYLLCSDGLTDMLADEVMAGILASDGTLAERARDLVDAANAQGGLDNISVLLAQASAS